MKRRTAALFLLALAAAWGSAPQAARRAGPRGRAGRRVFDVAYDVRLVPTEGVAHVAIRLAGSRQPGELDLASGSIANGSATSAATESVTPSAEGDRVEWRPPDAGGDAALRRPHRPSARREELRRSLRPGLGDLSRRRPGAARAAAHGGASRIPRAAAAAPARRAGAPSRRIRARRTGPSRSGIPTGASIGRPVGSRWGTWACCASGSRACTWPWPVRSTSACTVSTGSRSCAGRCRSCATIAGELPDATAGRGRGRSDVARRALGPELGVPAREPAADQPRRHQPPAARADARHARHLARARGRLDRRRPRRDATRSSCWCARARSRRSATRRRSRSSRDRGRQAPTLEVERASGATTARAVTVLHALDREIRDGSGGARSLDDVVRILFQQSGEVTSRAAAADRRGPLAGRKLTPSSGARRAEGERASKARAGPRC